MLDSVYGNERLIKHLKNTVSTGNIGHCYLFHGEKGLGKRTVAKEFAMAIMCQAPDRPCHRCSDCVRIMREDHPDVHFVQHTKAVFSVDDIRDGLNREIVNRPISGSRRIFILDDAELLNTQAQNAMLKTIEEPPEYATIMLLSDNRDALLPTVLSRCVELSLKPLRDSQVERALTGEDAQLKEAAVRHGGGNIGRAKRYLEDEAYREWVDTLGKILRALPDSDIVQLRRAAASIGTDKDRLIEMLSQMQRWFSGLMKTKAQGEGPDIGCAAEYSYEDFPRIFAAIENFSTRMKVNVNAELSLLLLLQEACPARN